MGPGINALQEGERHVCVTWCGKSTRFFFIRQLSQALAARRSFSTRFFGISVGLERLQVRALYFINTHWYTLSALGVRHS